MLFDLLSEESETLSKAKLTNIIRIFELPLNFEDFFSSLGKKEDISFQDFCGLLRSNKDNKQIFINSFSAGFYENNDKDIFPVRVMKKKVVMEL
jgi:hypothetical protein